MTHPRFPELSETTETILVGASAETTIHEIACEVHLSESCVRSRLWAAVRRVWHARKPLRRAPKRLAEIPIAVLLLEAPELADHREALVGALPLGIDPEATRIYMEETT